jgi:hypothetical protein
MELLFRHFWVALVVVSLMNGRVWWARVQDRIQAQPHLEPGYRRLYRGYLVLANVPWLAMGVGILSGQVTSTIDFLRPGEGNAFVLKWWGLMAALVCLVSYWIVFRGGAETLARHPGFHMVPEWTASKLKILWLGIVAWNAAIATLLFLGLPGALTQGGRSPAGNSWLWALFPLLFAIIWLLLSFVLSSMGGWGALAEQYAARSPYAGKRFRFRSAQFGDYVNYGSCLTFGAGPLSNGASSVDHSVVRHHGTRGSWLARLANRTPIHEGARGIH